MTNLIFEFTITKKEREKEEAIWKEGENMRDTSSNRLRIQYIGISMENGSMI